MSNGKKFEEMTKKFFENIFSKLGYKILEIRAQKSGTQNGFDVFVKFLDFQNNEQRFHIECKDYTTALNFSDLFVKIIQLKSTKYKPTAFIGISPKVEISNMDHNVLNSVERESFPIELWDENNYIKEIFSLDGDIYREIYGESAPLLENKEEALEKFKSKIENLINKNLENKKIEISSSSLDNLDAEAITRLDEKLIEVLPIEKDRLECHQHLCDYRVYLSKLEGQNEMLRQEILNWENSLRIKAKRLTMIFKNSEEDTIKFYAEFFKEAEKSLRDFMSGKYQLEGLEKLLNGIIYQLASQCPLDWRKENATQ